jgi:predicted ATPase
VRIDRLAVRGFRNLGDFTVDFNEDNFSTVLIGENGTGKSNLIEAIVLIFRHLDADLAVPFDYDISYHCRGRVIRVAASSGGRPQISWSDDELGTPNPISWRNFTDDRDEYLPKYIFAYYSGPSHRLQQYFTYHQNRYYDQVVNDESGAAPPIRRLFYCLPEHSRWVLLAYFLRGSEPPDFLRRFFGIDSFDSALLVLKKPDWAKKWTARKPPPERIRDLGDERFWWSRGVVKTFLQRLWDVSLAPVRIIELHQEDYRLKPTSEEHLYLYLSNLLALQRLNSFYTDEAALFAALESTEISNLVRDVRVRVKRGGESVVFSELSEGEQQLLTVVGLMQFTRHDESLFLLDEPDTHLNPVWKLRYLDELARQAGLTGGSTDGDESELLDKTSQLILTTHDPLTIAGLRHSQVLIFKRLQNRILVDHPYEDPRGMGVAGVLIRLFGLPSTLDPRTQNKIDLRNRLLRNADRSQQEDELLTELTEDLSDLGLAYDSRDPDYRAYLQALHRRMIRSGQDLRELSPEEQDEIVDSILEELMTERN